MENSSHTHWVTFFIIIFLFFITWDLKDKVFKLEKRIEILESNTELLK
jgi:hypothetical protein